jgi:hypothetical protein
MNDQRVRESSCKVKGKDRYEKEKSGILKTENNCIRIIGAENTVTVCETQGSQQMKHGRRK